MSDPANTVMIHKDEYYRLLVSQGELSLLEYAGVDNWGYYGEAFYRHDPDYTLDHVKRAAYAQVYGDNNGAS